MRNKALPGIMKCKKGNSPFHATNVDSQLISGARGAVTKPEGTTTDLLKAGLDTGKPMIEKLESEYEPI
tara:strand:- start:447 stop:653 length:207 start_codon:yes stop_codon:yes gene_type:complete